MKIKTVSLIITTVLISTLVFTSGYISAENHGEFSYTESDGTLEITGYSGAAADLVIPSEINGLAVTSIGASAFYGCRELTSVTIPSSVTSIGNGAFSLCFGISALTLPGSVESIGGGAFSNCISLVSVNLPFGVVSIGEYAFIDCSALSAITLPGSVESIGDGAFENCNSLSALTLPDSVKSIGYETFRDCTNLAEITFKGSAPDLEYNSFAGVCADVYYPADDTTWTDDVMQDYGGTLTWHKICEVHSFSEEWTVDTKAEFGMPGVKSRHCENCSAVTDERVSFVDSAEVFKNFTAKNWSKEGIDYAVTYGYMNGLIDGTFNQTGNMTRAMAVTVLWRMEGSPEPTVENPFTDFSPTQTWYHKAVVWAYENGIVTGRSSSEFDPTAPVTRQEMAAFFYRYGKYRGEDVSVTTDLSAYPDWADVSAFAKEPISWAAQAGLITGSKGSDGETRILPRGNATREQIATVLMRFCKGYIEK